MRPEGVLRDVRDGVALVEYPGVPEEDANRAAVGLAERLSGGAVPGVLDAVPAARTLLVVFDPERLPRERLEEEIGRPAAESKAERHAGKLLRVPVVYGGADGQDLAELARGAGLSAEEFARRHASAEYRVAFIGFAPGFPYLAGLPAELAASRLPTPRPRVPAGSVAIGGPFSGIYPGETPGGWRLIGRTSVRFFDSDADPPALLAAGDRVRFDVAGPDDVPTHGPIARALAPQGRPIFRVLAAGVFASIQGAPVHGFGSSGVPAGGAMDADALARANSLVGNAAGQAALEMTVVGPELEALDAATVAIAGADLAAEVNGRPAPLGEAFAVGLGDWLRFARARCGARAYLAVAGGLEKGRQTVRIKAGDRIAAGSRPSAAGPRSHGARPPAEEIGAEILLRVILGPQADHFPEAAIDRLLSGNWRVSAMSDRRGLRLEGERLEHVREPEIPPEGAVAGSIQVPGGGSPIILGPDGPVTGGYPKIATVIGADLPLLGQAAPGALLRFAAVSLADALRARREYD